MKAHDKWSRKSSKQQKLTYSVQLQYLKINTLLRLIFVIKVYIPLKNGFLRENLIYKRPEVYIKNSAVEAKILRK